MMDAFDQWVLRLPPGGYLLLWVGLIVLTLVGVIAGMYYLKRSRWIKDTATSKIRSAHQGFVELEGTAKPLEAHYQLKSPLSGTDCVWFDIRVEQYQNEYGGNNDRWKTVVRQVSDQMIRIDDGTGTCLIDPEGASIYPGFKRSWRGRTEMPAWGTRPGKTSVLFGSAALMGLGKQYRYTERLLLENADLYVLGLFKTLGHNPGADIEAKTAALLKQWKQDPQRMKQFDLNQDGRIDMKEWAWARRLARAEAKVQQAQVAMAESEIHTMSKPKDGRPFILSGIPQKTLVRRKRRRGFAIWAVSIVLFGLWIYVGDLRGGPF